MREWDIHGIALEDVVSFLPRQQVSAFQAMTCSSVGRTWTGFSHAGLPLVLVRLFGALVGL